MATHFNNFSLPSSSLALVLLCSSGSISTNQSCCDQMRSMRTRLVTGAFRSHLAALRRKGKRAAAQAAVAAAAVMACMAMGRPQKRCFLESFAAANNGYALQQLFSAIFVIGLG